MTEQDQRISQRYAGRAAAWPRIFLALCLALIVGLAGWLAWAVWVHSTPEVTSSLTRWKVVDAHEVTASVTVSLGDGASEPRCRLRAYAEDHTIVGEASFVPRDGTNDVSLRTEREATSVESLGCTASGQDDAR